MSTIKADNFTWKSGESGGQAQYTVTADKVILGTTKMWVNFNSTSGAGVTRASFNLSSITYYSTGDLGMNFTNAMADANYAFSATCSQNESPGYTAMAIGAASTSSSSARVTYRNYANSHTNPYYGSFTVNR